MRKVHRWLRVGAALSMVVGVLVPASAARGAGFAIFEAGAKATGLSGAVVASINDGSAMFYNPAGLAEIRKTTGMVGVTLIVPRSSFDGADPYPGSTYSAEQKKMVFFPPNFYLSMPLGDRVTISGGSWFPYGLSTAWEDPDNFLGRYLSTRVELRQYALGLQAGVKVTDWLNIGAGPELRISDVKLFRKYPVFNPYTNRVQDAAHVQVVGDGFETSLTFGAGLQIKPHECVRIGASYHGEVKQDYEGTAVFFKRPTGYADLDARLAALVPFDKDVPVSTQVQFPAQWLFGAAVDVTPWLTLEANAQYTEWEVFDKTVLNFSAVDGKQVPSTTIQHDSENVWAYRFGATIKASEKVNVLLGGLYDQTPQPDKAVSPLLPDANRTGISVGATFQIGEKSHLDVGNLFLFFHERTTSTNKDNYNGTYDTFADLFVVNFRMAF